MSQGLQLDRSICSGDERIQDYCETGKKSVTEIPLPCARQKKSGCKYCKLFSKIGGKLAWKNSEPTV